MNLNRQRIHPTWFKIGWMWWWVATIIVYTEIIVGLQFPPVYLDQLQLKLFLWITLALMIPIFLWSLTTIWILHKKIRRIEIEIIVLELIKELKDERIL